MKKKFSKILGVGLTLALLFSLLLTAAPVSADVTEPTVSLDETEISADPVVYTITFRINTALDSADTITVRFPDDTAVATTPDVTIEGWILVGGATLDFGLIDTPVAAGDADTREVEISWSNDTITTLGVVEVEFSTGITNPSDVRDDYTLEVKTSEEDTYVESESYEIIAPLLAGGIYVYNAANIQMSFETDLDTAANSVTGVGWTILVSPGTYVLSGTLSLDEEGLTLVSSAGAADTTIDAASNGITITGEGVTIVDFTIDGASTAVSVDAEDVTVTKCIITDATIGVQIDDGGLDATVSDNVIEDCADGVVFVATAAIDMGDVDITGNEITGADNSGGIVFLGGNVDIDITGNTITGNDVAGIYFDANANACDDIDIKGNTISENEGDGIDIAASTAAPTDLIIAENDILDNVGDGIAIAATAWTVTDSYIVANNIHGNDTDVTTAVTGVNARLNYWGSADEDDFDIGSGVDYEPWLAGAQADTLAGYKVAISDDASVSLDAKSATGVKVSGVEDAGGDGAEIITAAKYIANPEEAIDDAIGFYDIFVAIDDTVCEPSEVTAKLKFYDAAITETSTVLYWTGDFWSEASDIDARDRIIYVTVTEDTIPTLEELEGTAFVVVAGPEVEDVLAAPTIVSPEGGERDVPLRPAFSWTQIAAADAYYFELADNANFVVPLMKLEGDVGRLIVTAYAYVTGLDYSTAYYWRVKAVSGTTEAGDLLESPWVSAVFITEAEPVEPVEPVEPADIILEPADIIIEPPDVIVTVPAETPITPTWIYVIIAVGAVLVIALLVLIVRTRRVA